MLEFVSQVETLKKKYQQLKLKTLDTSVAHLQEPHFGGH